VTDPAQLGSAWVCLDEQHVAEFAEEARKLLDEVRVMEHPATSDCS
jgi:hypothetical protein